MPTRPTPRTTCPGSSPRWPKAGPTTSAVASRRSRPTPAPWPAPSRSRSRIRSAWAIPTSESEPRSPAGWTPSPSAVTAVTYSAGSGSSTRTWSAIRTTSSTTVCSGRAAACSSCRGSWRGITPAAPSPSWRGCTTSTATSSRWLHGRSAGSRRSVSWFPPPSSSAWSSEAWSRWRGRRPDCCGWSSRGATPLPSRGSLCSAPAAEARAARWPSRSPFRCSTRATEGGSCGASGAGLWAGAGAGPIPARYRCRARRGGWLMGARVEVAGFMYHEVTDRPLESGFQRPGAVPYHLSRDALAAHLAQIQATTSAPELVTAIDLTSPARHLMLTFDDGGRSAVYVGDQLARLGWKGHFFVVTGRIGSPTFLDPAQIRYLQSCGHLIGSHSHSHPDIFRDLPPAAMLEEWRVSRDILEQLLGEPCRAASLPGGDISPAGGGAGGGGRPRFLVPPAACAA